MEFWGVEVKAGKPVKVNPDEDALIHISQASLGEAKDKKGAESVPLFVKVGDQKLVMGTLSQGNFPQISCDLAFEKEFELSHNWKHGSVYFMGYKSPNFEGQDEEGFYSDSEGSDGEEVPASVTENGKPGAAVGNAKAAEVKPKAKAKAAEVKKVEKLASKDDDSDEDDESEEEGMGLDDSDDSESEDKVVETPEKAAPTKKRVNESAPKTPVPSKKAKADASTPQKKIEEKKGGKKTPANGSKSGGQFSCGSCKKSFNSDNALQSHDKAKHAAK